MLAAARENLRHGASHIKLAAGGGDWQTYVTIHSYHPSAIHRAIDAGVKDVGHGQLLDEKTLRRMAQEGVFLSTQPFTVCYGQRRRALRNERTPKPLPRRGTWNVTGSRVTERPLVWQDLHIETPQSRYEFV